MNIDSGNGAGAQSPANAQPAQQGAAPPNGSADTSGKKEHSSTLQLTYDGAANPCGAGGSQRVKVDETVSFTAPKSCISSATLHWIRHNGSEETFALGSKSSPGGEVVLDVQPLDHGTETLYNYKVIR
jgi:hypothetical protein